MNRDLPEDILGEILVRLPIKSLFRFYCVSRTWRDLISSPDFANMRLNYTKNHHSDHHRAILVKQFIRDQKKILLTSHSYQEADEHDGNYASLSTQTAPDLEFPSSHPDSINLYGTCDGIVCIGEIRNWIFRYMDSDEDKIYLCNPATRQFMTLPPSPFGFPCIFRGGDYIESLGFGFDPSTKDYKVVKILHYYTQVILEIGAEIYELRTNSWRRLDKPPPEITCPWPEQRFSVSLLNGSLLHWLAGYSAYIPERCGILSFNMSTEEFKMIEIPCNDKDGVLNLAVLDGTLALILMKDKSDRTFMSGYECTVDIWVMKEYGIKESWIKKVSIEPFTFIEPTYSELCKAPLSSWNNDILLLQNDYGHLISCSLKNHCGQEICKYDDCELGHEGIEGLVYEETLVSLAEVGKG